MIRTLDELKSEFYSNSELTSRELFMYMELIVFKTHTIAEYFMHKQDELGYEANNDQLFNHIGRLNARKSLREKYPFISGGIDEVNYDDGETPREWDIAFRINSAGLRYPAVYVYLDGDFKRRCENGDPIVVVPEEEEVRINRGYRLKNV